MGVSKKKGYPQIIHFNRVFHEKPSILRENSLFLETPIYPLQEIYKNFMKAF